MEPATLGIGHLVEASKRLARRLFTIAENRLELAMLEMQEEREHLVFAVLLALSVAALGLLAGITLTAAIVVLLWNWSPVAILLVLTGLYGVAAMGLCRRLTGMLRERQRFPTTFDQLRKDRACLEKCLT